MSAGFSQNQRNTGGHRPPLQWAQPLFNGFCNTLNLAGEFRPRLSWNFLQYTPVPSPLYSRGMTTKIRWGRIVIAGFLIEAGIFAVFIPVFVYLGQQAAIYTAVVASFAMSVLFGIWVGRRIESGFVLHGMLAATVAVLIYIGLTLAQPEPWQYIVAHGLKILGGGLGGRAAEKRKIKVITQNLPGEETIS